MVQSSRRNVETTNTDGEIFATFRGLTAGTHRVVVTQGGQTLYIAEPDVSGPPPPQPVPVPVINDDPGWVSFDEQLNGDVLGDDIGYRPGIDRGLVIDLGELNLGNNLPEGRLRINHFISVDQLCLMGLCFEGDARGFSNKPGASSRTVTVIDFSRGYMLVMAQGSSEVGESITPANEWIYYHDIRHGAGHCQLFPCDNPPGFTENGLSFNASNGKLDIIFTSSDSAPPAALKPVTPTLVARSIVEWDSDTLDVSVSSSLFPSMEMYWEPDVGRRQRGDRHSESGGPLGILVPTASISSSFNLS